MMMALLVFQAALVALNRHRWVVASWLVGIVGLIAVLALPGDPVRLAAIAQMIGPAIALAAAGLALTRHLGDARHGPRIQNRR